MGKKLLVPIIAMLLALAASSVSAAEYGNPGLLVDTAFVKANKDKPGWVLLDARDEKAYAKGHIPGAIHLGKRADKSLRDPTATMLPVSKLEGILGKAGISDSSNIILYYDPATITRAGVAFHVLETLGCNSDALKCKVYWYNGGIVSWKADGGDLTKEAKTLPETTFKASPVWNRYATTDEVYFKATGNKPSNPLDEMTKRYGDSIVTYDPDTQLVDLRTKNEYDGKDIRALRGGHVPNTDLQVSHKELYDGKTGKIKSMDELEKLFGSLDKNKRLINYCQTGTRSSFGYFVFRLMGFKSPSNWDESWRVWASNVNYPVASEQWFDFNSVKKGKTKAWDSGLKDIAALKKQLAAVKKTAEEAKTTADAAKAQGKGICGPTALLALAMLPLGVYRLYRRKK